jgi:energy-coupling factor transport system permease protein
MDAGAAALGAGTVRFHPAAWMCWATCGGLVAFTTTNPFYLGLLVAVAWFVYATQRIPGPTARAFRVFAIGGLVAMALRTLLVMFGTVDAGAVAFAALEGARVAALLIVFGTFNAVTDPFGVVRLAPRRFHEPALAAALALSIAPRTIAMAGRVREAQRLRGIHATGWRSLPALAVPVLETGMEEAVTLAESMDARGHGRGRRTRYRPARWTLAAAAMTATALIAAGIFLAAAWTGRGGLHPSTAPLAWPSAEPLLLGAIALLALPGVLPRQRDDEVTAITTSEAPLEPLRHAASVPAMGQEPRSETTPALPVGGGP